MVNSRIRSCFVTAPADTNLDVLTEALRRRNIRIVGPEAISLGAAWETEISNLLNSADLSLALAISGWLDGVMGGEAGSALGPVRA